MISPLSSYDDELLNSAYANVSLIADEAWACDHEDPFRKLNHSLWIQVRRAIKILESIEDKVFEVSRVSRNIILIIPCVAPNEKNIAQTSIQTKF